MTTENTEATPNSTKSNLRIALAQINTVTGDIDSNAKKAIWTLEHAQRQEVDLVVFPELTLTGYPPRDLLDKPAFVEKNLHALADVAGHAKQCSAIIGHVERNRASEGKPLFNSASLIQRGLATPVCRKTLLPTYDVFDESRYFQQGAARIPHRFREHLLGVSICEDIWNNSLCSSSRLYEIDPIEQLVDAGSEILINVSASPYTHGRREEKTEMYSQVAKRHQRPLVMVNLVGGNDTLVFDGGSAVFGPDGSLLYQAPHFEESFEVIEMRALPEPVVAPMETIGDMHQALVLGVRDYLKKCCFKKALVGLSGGIDSAVTLALAAEALGSDGVMAVTMPSQYSSEGSVKDSEALAKNLNIELLNIPIQGMVNNYLGALEPHLGGDLGVTEENLQARTRGVLLMAISNKTGALLLTTGNKSEMAVGYATLYGDMAGGLAVISDVPKTMVYELANHINRHREIIPQSIIEKPPSAELRPDQRDTDSLPPYDILDPIMRMHVEQHMSAEEIAKKGFDEDVVKRIVRLITGAEYKRRQAPPGLRVTSKAFSDGWRMPIARGKMDL